MGISNSDLYEPAYETLTGIRCRHVLVHLTIFSDTRRIEGKRAFGGSNLADRP